MRTTNGFLKNSLLLGFLTLIPTSGCIAPTVIGGNNDTSSSSDTTSTMSGVSSSVGGQPGDGHAVALRAGTVMGTGGGGMTSVVSVGVGGAPDMTSGVGGAPPMTAGSGGAPSMSGAGGAPSMTGSGGAPPMTAGVGGAPPDMTSGVGGGYPGTDPDTLYLEIDSNPITCASPNSLVSGGDMCVSGTHLHVELPPAAQQVGVYHFNDGSGVNVFGSISLPDCGGGGGNIFDEVRVLSVTATAITVEVTGAISTPGFDPNGLYVVPRCEPIDSPPAQGIAIIAANIPDPGSTTSVGAGGAPPSMTDLVLVLHDTDATDVGAVCADPYGNDFCVNGEGGWEISVTLPLMYQVPGTYSLDDPNLNASFGDWQPSGMGECSGGGGSFFGGEIVVKSVTPTAIVAEFQGMIAAHGELLGHEITYARCSN